MIIEYAGFSATLMEIESVWYAFVRTHPMNHNFRPYIDFLEYVQFHLDELNRD